MQEKNYQQMVLTISNDNMPLYQKYLEEFGKLISQKKNIPYNILQDFLAITDIPAIYYENDLAIRNATAVAIKAVKYFEKCAAGAYNFTGNKRIKIDDKKLIEAYSLHSIFWPTLVKYYQQLNEKGAIDLKTTIHFFYELFKYERDAYFTPKHKKQCNHYKLAVMAAYVTQLTGLKVTNKKKFSNSDLYQSTRRLLPK